MLDILSYILAITAVAFIAGPFIRKSSSQMLAGKQESDKLNDLLNQRTLIADTKEDLEFDFQTGKLDKDDYDLLVNEQDGNLSILENKIQAQSGISSGKLVQQLESEILKERQKSNPELKTKCTQCGSNLQPGVKFCSNCGAKIQT